MIGGRIVAYPGRPGKMGLKERLRPIDAVPDFLPGGYLDDLAVMALVLAKVNAYETPGAKERMEKLLPDRCRES